MWSAGGKAGRQGGFTLLELLVVMLIITLSVVAIAAALPRGAPGPVVDLAATRLADGFKTARMRAVSRGVVVAVTLDPAGRRYRVGRTGKVVTLPAEVRVTALGPSVIRFFPDGGADAGAVRLAANNRVRRIDLSPLTGRVALR